MNNIHNNPTNTTNPTSPTNPIIRRPRSDAIGNETDLLVNTILRNANNSPRRLQSTRNPRSNGLSHIISQTLDTSHHRTK